MDVDEGGRLVVRTEAGEERLGAGDVVHVRRSELRRPAPEPPGGRRCRGMIALWRSRRKLLNEGEHIVLSTRTHVKALLLPAVVLIIVAGLAGYLTSLPSGDSAGDLADW